MYPFIPWPNYIFDFQTFPIKGRAGGGNIKFLPTNQKQSNSKLKLKLLMHRFIFLISFVCSFLRMKLIISLIKHSSLLLKLLSYSTTFSAPDFPVDCNVYFQEPAGTVYLQWVSAARRISDYFSAVSSPSRTWVWSCTQDTDTAEPLFTKEESQLVNHLQSQTSNHLSWRCFLLLCE